MATAFWAGRRGARRSGLLSRRARPSLRFRQGGGCFLPCEIVACLSALSWLSVSGDSRFWRGFARQGDGEVMPGRT